MSETTNLERLHNFDLASFRKAQDAMIATSDNSYGVSMVTNTAIESEIIQKKK